MLLPIQIRIKKTEVRHLKSMVTIFTGVEMAVFGQSLLKCRKKLAFRQLQSFEDCICSKFRKETNEANPQKHDASQSHAKGSRVEIFQFIKEPCW